MLSNKKFNGIKHSNMNICVVFFWKTKYVKFNNNIENIKGKFEFYEIMNEMKIA